MRARWCIATLLSLIGAIQVAAVQLKVEVTQCRAVDDDGRICVFFGDDPIPILLSATFVSVYAPGSRPTDAVFTFPSQSWLDSIELTLTDINQGVVVTPQIRLVRTAFRGGDYSGKERPVGRGFVLRDHETADAYLELSGLPVGEYRIEAALGRVGRLWSPGRFSIRRGDEDEETIKAHYRYRAAKAVNNFREWESIVREMMARFEPENARILVSIADMSVDRVPDEESVAYYREAHAALAAQLRADLARTGGVSARDRQKREEELHELTIFETVLPFYRQNRDRLRFAAHFGEDGHSYAWYDKNGHLVRRIDPRDPLREPGEAPRK